jgi:putative membrane protein
MRKTVTAAALAGMFGLASVAVAGTASAATPSLSAQDRAFMQSNQQSNLAEITIGQLALRRAQYPATRELATRTLGDHQVLSARLSALAGQYGVSLPTTPNPTQQQLAAALQAVSTSGFDRIYDAGQVSSHQSALAGTNAELMSGSSSAVRSYATFYTQLATPHLRMAAADLAALTGTQPAAVLAGSGGLAATDSGPSNAALAALAAGLAVMAGSGTVLVRARRSRRAVRSLA